MDEISRQVEVISENIPRKDGKKIMCFPSGEKKS